MSKDETSIQMAAQTTIAPAVNAEVDALRREAMAELGAESLTIPILHLFQDTGNEAETYGEHDKGTWVDGLSQEPYDVGTRIVPVFAKAYKAAWYDRKSGKGEGRPVATWNPKREPRPFNDSDGNPIDWTDPDLRIDDQIDLYVLVGEGAGLPHVYRAKKTTLASVKQLNSLEASRGAAGRPVGAYALDTRSRSNDYGKWFVPYFRPDGDATPDEMDVYASALRMVLSGNTNVAEDVKPAGINTAAVVDEPPF